MSWLIWLWLGIFILSIIVEIFTEELVSVWIAGGSLVALIISIFTPVSLWWVQLLTFLVISVALIFALRPYIRKFLKVNQRKTNVDSMVGEKATVTKKITELEHGSVKHKGAIWPAVSLDNSEIDVDEVVIIENIQGNKLVVRVVHKN